MKLLGRRPSKLLIAIPTRGAMDAHFVHSFGMLIAHTTSVLQKVDGASLGMSFCHGTYIHEQRNDLVAEAIRTEVDAVLWLDDDMTFPRDAALRLMKRRRPFVGVNYPTRTVECRPTAIKRVSVAPGDPGERLYRFEGEGLAKVEAVGLGLALVHADVLHAVPYPWFETVYDPTLKQFVGEDVDFCRKVRKAGFDVEIDLELSRKVAHTGRFQYTLEHAAAYAALEAGEGAA